MYNKPIEECEFYTTVYYAGLYWELIDKEYSTDHVCIRRMNVRGKWVYRKLAFGTMVCAN